MNIDSNFFCKLIISDLTLSVRLGCREHEKEREQLVSVSIEICFKDLPVGAETDDIEDVICYSNLSKYIQKLIEGKSFNLIEKFSKDIHKYICKFLIEEGYTSELVKVTTHKLMSEQSPIKGGVSFTYLKGDS